MSYSEVSFLFYALAAIALYYCSPRSWRVSILFLTSLFWIGMWRIEWIGCYLTILSLNYVYLVGFVKKQDEIKKNRSYLLLVSLNLIIFILLKSHVLGIRSLYSPFGLSFFTLAMVGYIIDMWRNDSLINEIDPIHYFTFPLFFPILMGGPIVRAKEIIEQFRKKEQFKIENLINGLMIFCYGFLKIHLISKKLNIINVELVSDLDQTFQLPQLVLVGLIGTIQAFIDFSSYCDMGRGIAKCLDINLKINFRSILYAKNPIDYWQRWNITLGTWIRDYITFPIILKWGRTINQNVLLVFTFILVGLWHGLTLNWVVFGLFNGIIVIIFNRFQFIKWNKVLGKILVFLIIMLNGLLQKNDLIYKMFDIKNYVTDYNTLNYLIPVFADLGLSFIVIGLIFLIIEYLQESKENVDFYTNLRLAFKIPMLIIFFIWLFLCLNNNQFIEDKILPPAYFRI